MNRYGISLWGDGNMLELNSGDGCIACKRNVLNAIELCILEWLLLC